MASEWNEDGEQYRVILNDELAATFTDTDTAYDFYTEHVCQYCRTHPTERGDSRCCDIQTWTKDVSPVCDACGQPSINPLRDGRCIVCELLQVAS